MPPQYSTPISDKIFWHGYIDFYERFFSTRAFHQIAEFGIFKGDSIRWLLQRFPMAQISGADILPLQSEWPNDSRVRYTQLDQSSRRQIHDFLNGNSFDLIIEDGSHLPLHQINCLIEGMKALTPNGIYILEDIQTSKKNHPLWIQNNPSWQLRKVTRKRLFFESQGLDKGNALNLLLGIDHYIRLGNSFDHKAIAALAKNSLFSINEIKQLTEQIKEVHLYKRTHLPDYCCSCGSKDFSFSALQCICGQDIFSDCDSMSFVIIKNDCP
jgi:trans-aconitate methyltransferase